VIAENIAMVKKVQPEQDAQDSPWKTMVRTYLREGVEFLFPDVAAIVDWTKPPIFLDKEFVQIAPDAKVGRRYADQLVQLQRKKGKPLVLLLHIEIQASPEGKFTERMFIYALRIFDLFRQPAVSLAILCDTNPNWRPKQYSFALPQTSLNFEFGTVKLLDYKERWAELESSRNPFAWVVMAHLKMQETKQDKPSRKIWKLRLIRQLHESGYNKDDILNLFHFIDYLLHLPKALESEFWQELKTYEEERKVPYITSVERIGYDRGKVSGFEEGERSIVLRLLNRRFGKLNDCTIDRITALSPKKLESLSDALLDFATIEDLTIWLDNH
jgi:predicted DNA-binding ribbon-helix-helix protein